MFSFFFSFFFFYFHFSSFLKENKQLNAHGRPGYKHIRTFPVLSTKDELPSLLFIYGRRDVDYISVSTYSKMILIDEKIGRNAFPSK